MVWLKVYVGRRSDCLSVLVVESLFTWIGILKNFIPILLTVHHDSNLVVQRSRSNSQKFVVIVCKCFYLRKNKHTSPCLIHYPKNPKTKKGKTFENRKM